MHGRLTVVVFDHSVPERVKLLSCLQLCSYQINFSITQKAKAQRRNWKMSLLIIFFCHLFINPLAYLTGLQSLSFLKISPKTYVKVFDAYRPCEPQLSVLLTGKLAWTHLCASYLSIFFSTVTFCSVLLT